MSSSGQRRSSQAPPPNVNLYCRQCESQIGIFDNEWIRLTASYARAKEKGTHFGTDIGQKTQTVPKGVAQLSAEGCEMSDVFCKKCSNSVGQYCRSAPDASKQYLINQYFYKISRTYLKDAQTSKKVQYVFGFGGEVSLPPPFPKPSATPRPSLLSNLRWSQTPMRDNRSSQTPGWAHDNLRNYPYSADATPATLSELAQENVLMNRFTELEQRLARYENRMASDNLQSSRNSTSGRVLSNSFQTDENHSDMQPTPHIPPSYDFQIRPQIEILQDTLKSIQTSLQEICSEIRTYRRATSANTDILAKLENSLVEFRCSNPTSQELHGLRAENKALKERMSKVASAMGIPTSDISIADSIDATPERDLASLGVLGKRKREGENARSTSLRLSDSVYSRESRLRQSFEMPNQIPTPQSGCSNPSGEVFPAETRPESRISSADHGSLKNGSLIGDNDDAMGSVENDRDDLQNNLDAAEQDLQREPRAAMTMAMTTTLSAENEHVDNTVRQFSAGEMDGNPIDFSDDNMDSNHNTDIGTATDIQVASDSGDIDADLSHMSAPEKLVTEPAIDQVEVSELSNKTAEDTRTLSRTNRRRTTDPIVPRNARSVAPSVPPSKAINRKSRTITTRRAPTSGVENVTIFTPSDIKQHIEDEGKPKQPKERIQTTEKLLNIELEQLGLSEWVGKDKNTAEYRAVVEAARAQRRENKKLEVLASRGLKPKPKTKTPTLNVADAMPGIALQQNQNSTAESPTAVVSNSKTKASGPLSEVTNQQSKRADVAEKLGSGSSEGVDAPIVSSTPRVMTRRQQREEIRKRDQLAQEAMEREEMA